MPNDELLSLARKRLPELESMTVADFVSWLARHLEMYEYFRRYAREAINKGRPRFSVYMIRERVRWYVNIEYGSDEPFKVSNNVCPYLARLLAYEMPELRSIFTFKGPFEFENPQGSLL